MTRRSNPMISERKSPVPVVWLRTLFVAMALAIALPGIAFALGDVIVSVDRADDLERTDLCKYCKRYVRPGATHKDAHITVMNQLQKALIERSIGFAEKGAKASTVNVYVYRFEERKGGNFAVERPASVGFHMHLMEQGAVTKVFVFDEHQQSLMENVLDIGKFFRRGAKWVTAEELAVEGIDMGLKYIFEEKE
jgi:hypothetical protein